MKTRIAAFVSVCAVAALAAMCAQSAGPTIELTTRPSPLGLGQNLFDVTLKDANGQPIADAEVTLVLLMPADPKTKHPEMKTEGTLNNVGNGRYSGIAMVTMAGAWDVTVTASRNGQQIAQKKEQMTAHLTAPKP
jgi:nitrogen fixation protein FixH